MQTYALQNTLNALGIENEVIDFRSGMIEDLYIPFQKRNIKNLAFIPCLKKKKVFDRFLNKNITMSASVDRNELISSEKKYDKYITGSDQVFCKKCATDEKTYFLDFVKESSRKKSYAASIGNANLSEKEKAIYKELLENYDEVSVRENSAKEIFSNASLFDKTINVNVDPTLLLRADEWDKVRNHNMQKAPYILVYTVLGEYNLLDEALKLSQKTGYRVIYLNDTMIRRKKGMKYEIAVSPEDFIGYFAEAEYVLTNSFHGTAFSIIYNKQFKVEIEAKGRRNIRSEELLSMLGLSKRFLEEDGIADIEDEIDWESVNRILGQEQEKSKNYLQHICK